ncbi:PLP-dependent aminotransferase family protein [Ruminococcaceae bacterium OttesenSCG-928-D13]|nr:PLP-dependent aminotransferase family protein [Ruminococcaceae bacterium OttesenSCG-928-D13]
MDFIDIFLNKRDKEPLYYQLYRHLSSEIRGGALPAGTRLPGKRAASAQLGVSVNTVDEAYQMLAAEGYVEARPRSGFVVNRVEGLVGPAGGVAMPGRGGVGESEQNIYNDGNILIVDRNRQEKEREKTGEATPAGYTLATGGLDVSLFPLKTWTRLLKEQLGGPEGQALFARGESGGDAVLRGAITGYLHSYRGVRCTADQLVVGAGLEVLTGMLGRLLGPVPVAVEDPGYAKTGRLLQNMGVPVVPVPVDEGGMAPEALAASGAATAYLTPSHQFPTGGVMPVGRRTELLRWAAAGGRWIIEDDYDSEFRFDGRPLPCLQGLDTAGHVIYAGTFSRSLAPGLRAAYLVLPPALLEQWRAAYGDYACTVSRPEQHALARLMSEGHFARGLNRSRAAYRRRRDALVAALEAAFSGAGVAHRVENAHTGLYFILRLPGRNAKKIAEKSRENGLWLRALDEYRALPAAKNETADALVVGYGGLRDEEIAPAVERLLKTVDNW